MWIVRFFAANAPFLTAGMLLAFSSSWGQTYFISLFADQIMTEIGISDAVWGLTYMCATMVSAAVMVWAGTLTDRFRARAILIVVLPGLALACVGMSVNGTLVGLFVLIFCLRVFGQGMLSQLAIVSMARWFVASRGLALSFATLGYSIGNAILPFLFVSALAYITWRQSWLVAAALCLIAVPILWSLLKAERTPQSVADSNEETGMQGRHWTRAEMVRHPLFWFLVPMILAVPAWGTVLFFQQVHFVDVKGWSLAAFTALFPAYVVTAIVTTFVSGSVIDRFGASVMMRIWPFPWAAGFAVLAVAPSLPVAAVALIFCGIGQGIGANASTSFLSEVYGTRHLGGIKAVSTALMVLGSALGPGLTGALITWGIGIEWQYSAIAVHFLISAALLWIGLSLVPRYSAVAP